jgi:hypothetical protein
MLIIIRGINEKSEMQRGQGKGSIQCETVQHTKFLELDRLPGGQKEATGENCARGASGILSIRKPGL